MELLTITQASDFAAKSIQTIRRMIKKNKVKVKRQKTPQGFNYLVIKESLIDFINSEKGEAIMGNQTFSEPTERAPERPHRTIEPPIQNDSTLFREDLTRLTSTIQDLVRQNETDKRNFFDLIKTFQDRVVNLEDQIKMLDGPKSSWWQFWR